jgi:hypothetical protein
MTFEQTMKEFIVEPYVDLIDDYLDKQKQEAELTVERLDDIINNKNIF